MKRLCLAIFGLGFVSSTAIADEIYTVKANVISSESELKANSVQIDGAGADTRTLAGDDDSVTAFGYGADVDFRIRDMYHAGVGIAFTDYMNDNEKTSYSDVAPRVYGSVDLVTQPAYTINFLAGVSYHYLNLKDTHVGPATVEYEDLDLWNWDLGLSLNGSIAKNLMMGLGYQYTNTFQAEGVDVNYAGPGVTPGPARLKDMKIAKNEVVGSVGVVF